MNRTSRSKRNMRVSHLLAVALCLSLFVFGSSEALAADAALKLSVNVGPPTTNVMVTGKSFGTHETVDLFLTRPS
jgi:glucose-6-phosphate isomerase